VPLPITSTPWPPKQLEHVTPVLTSWAAWWTGDPTALTGVYQGVTAGALDRPSQRRGGVAGALARFWWGRPTSLTAKRDFTHVPLAADIARTSADLLFADPPKITVAHPATQARLDDALGDRTFSALTGAAETSAALGGVYLRVVWDRAVSASAFLGVVSADAAVPEFTWDRLSAVTFWKVLAVDGQRHLRHLERHELVGGIGMIQHGLYDGTSTQLGRAIALTEHPSTAPLATAVDDGGYIIEGRTPGLNVEYVPNCDPVVARRFRTTPAAGGLGASDFDGVEPLLDNLDEIHSSWMRDLRLAKARLLIARYMLDGNGPGAGASFDADAEIFTPLKMAAGEEGDSPITPVQFAIRFAEHQATSHEWTERIVRAAGYSMQTFGESSDVQATATEVNARTTRSMLTRDRKLRMWRPALTRIMRKLLEVDAAVFPRAVDTTGLTVTFPDGAQASPLEIAQTSLALSQAQAASRRTLVALNHPDWDDTRVNEEVDLIGTEQGAPVGDPFAIR